MKTLLVPVDFSRPAENAAKYAMHLAQIVKSNLCLCHAFIVPAEATGSAQVAWPLYEMSTLESVAENHLEQLAKKLTLSIQLVTSSSAFNPTISIAAVPGETADMLDQLVIDKNAGLVIMGLSGAGAALRFFMGSVSRRVIELAKYPVLLIPSDFKFRPIKKIALATDLSVSDIDVLHTLSKFAALVRADLVITYISAESDDAEIVKKRSQLFLREVTNKIDYDRIYYRQVMHAQIDEGLDWLVENGKIDLLVMVHHHKALLSRMFRSSHTKKLAAPIDIPLMVFPSAQQFTL